MTPTEIAALKAGLRELQLDHVPDGYPCVTMGEITALLDSHDILEKLVASLSERCHKQSELLARRAEKP